MMMLHKMGWLFQKVLYPKLTWKRYTAEHKVYLTFDDGPIPEVTPFVLDILKEYQAKATFFCVGENIMKNPTLFKRILSEGHSVGNHTFNHLNGWKTPKSIYLENVKQCQQTMDDAMKMMPNNTGRRLFRPPYGRINRSQWKPLLSDYDIIMWDVLSGDFDSTIPKEVCLEKTIKYTEPGSIVVFHDNIKAVKNMYYTLPRFLEFFQNRNWEFSPL